MSGLTSFFKAPGSIVSLLETESNASIPACTKLGATLGPASNDEATLQAMLGAGMSVARIDLSAKDTESHKTTLVNLRKAQRVTKKLCALMVDTHGPEVQVVNVPEDASWSINAGDSITLTTDTHAPATAQRLPVTAHSLASLPVGSNVFVGQYLFTGAETSSAYLTVENVSQTEAVCKVTNDCTLTGASRLVVHMFHGNMGGSIFAPVDMEALAGWVSEANIDYLALSVTRSAADVAEARAALDKVGLTDTKIFAKIESKEGLAAHKEIIAAADGIVFSRGLMGLEVEAEKMFKVQKMLLHECNNAGRPVWTTRVIDTMSTNPRPTRAEATDVANLVLDGVDGILLGSETFRGSFPVTSVETVLAICKQAEKCFDHHKFYEHTLYGHKDVPLPMISKAEALASSAVRAAAKLDAQLIIVFTRTGRTARMIAKYKPSVPILAVVVPHLSSNGIKWVLSGGSQARQVCALRGVIPFLADPTVKGAAEGSMASYAMSHAMKLGLCVPGDKVVISQCPRSAVPNGPMSEAGVLKIATVDAQVSHTSMRRLGTVDDLKDLTGAVQATSLEVR